MKQAILSIASLILLQAAHAGATTLQSLDCVTNTGVIIKSTGASEQGLAVQSQWGIYQKNFTAIVEVSRVDQTSFVELTDGQSVQYLLALSLSDSETGVQHLSGSLLQPSGVQGLPPTVVGFAQCDVQVQQ